MLALVAILTRSLHCHCARHQVECVAVSGGGDLIATGSRDGKIVVSKAPVLLQTAEADENRISHQEWRKVQATEEAKAWQDEVI